jgi:hypothetical protein
MMKPRHIVLTPRGRSKRRANAGVTVANVLSAAFLILACQAPVPADSDSALVWGIVRIVPRDGVTPVRADDPAYADRRLQDVEFVDYERPGFVVVYSDGPAPDDVAEVAIRETRHRIRITPERSVAGRAGTISIRNETLQAQVVSDPAQGIMRSVAPSEEFLIRDPDPGLHSLYVLGHPGLHADVFVAPGPFTLGAWHPRFPEISHQVRLDAGESLRRDLRLGVDVSKRIELNGE